MSLQYIEDFSSSSSSASSSLPSPILTIQWATTNLVLTGHLDGTLCAFDATNGTLLARIKAHQLALPSLSVVQSGTRALSTSHNGSASLWDLQGLSAAAAERQAENHPAVGHDDRNDGERAASSPLASSALHVPILEDFKPLAAAHSLLDEAGDVLDLVTAALHPTASFFAAAGRGATLSLYSSEQETFGQLLCSKSPRPKSAATVTVYALSMAFSPSGRYVAVGTDLGHVHLFACSSSSTTSPTTTPSLELIANYTSHALPIRTLAFDSTLSGRDNHLFVGSDDRLITLYDLASLTPDPPAVLLNPISFLKGHKGAVDQISPVPRPPRSAFSAQGAGKTRTPLLLASTSVQDGFIRLWDIEQRPKRSVCIIRATGDTSSALTVKPTSSGHGEQGGLHDVDAEGQASDPPHARTSLENGLAEEAKSLASGATSLAWRPVDLDSDGHLKAQSLPGSAFVAGGTDGVVRWYRAGGTGNDI